MPNDETTPSLVGDIDTTPTPTIDSEENHVFGALNTILLVFVLFCCVLFGYLSKRFRFTHIPESGASMLVGIIVGGFAKLLRDEDELEILKFNPEVFFFILLPPIIFEAGFTLKKKRFFGNIGTILLYAVVGTLISTFVVGGITYGAASSGVISMDKSSMLPSLLFGALISAVDPVATLAIIGNPEMNCDPLLYSLVFGESVLNDAVAIVLFHVFNEYSHKDSFTRGDLFSVVLRFFSISLGSVSVGLIFGLGCSFLFRHSNVREFHTYEIQLIFLFAFGCFGVAELVGCSGVMSLFFCGVVLSHYNFHNMSHQSKVSSIYVFEALASSSEALVFAYMGMSLFTSGASWDVGFIVISIFACMLARALNIFPLSFLANFFRRNKVPINMQLVMFLSGLRGAVAYALSQQLQSSSQDGHLGAEVTQTTTLAIVMFTTFFLGGTTSPTLSRLGMKNAPRVGGGASSTLREDFSRYTSMDDGGFDGGHRSPTHSVSEEPGRFSAFWERVDRKLMKPVFGGDVPNSARTLDVTGDHVAEFLDQRPAQPTINVEIPTLGGLSSEDYTPPPREVAST